MTAKTHPAWCTAEPGHDACYSDAVETAVGGMWIEQGEQGPHIVIDLTRDTPILTIADAGAMSAVFADLTAALAGGGGGG